MGIQFIRGRDFTSSDRADSEQVAIVNSSLARRYFGGQDPLGKVLELGDAAHAERWRIVGLVADVKAFGPEQISHADIYRPVAQVYFPLLAFTVRTARDASALLNPAKQAIWDVDKDQPIFDAMPMQQLATQSVTLRRTSTILLSGFASLALILAAVGLYGVMAYSVAQHTREIGIRMAMGARRGDVLLLVVGNGLRAVLIGEIIGLIAALIVTRIASTLLFGVGPSDPATFAFAVCVLTAVTLFASYVPARRAAKVDPMVALRYE
jgi:putative ABC transport system permease protein